MRCGGQRRSAYWRLRGGARQRGQNQDRGKGGRRRCEGEPDPPSRRPSLPAGKFRVFFSHAPSESARGIDVTLGLERRLEADPRIWVAAPARALERLVGTNHIPARGEQDAEAERGSRMAGRVSEFIGVFRAGHVAARFEQAAEVERAVRIAAFARALVAGPRLLQLATLFEEDPEVDRRGGMAKHIGLPICAFGGG